MRFKRSIMLVVVGASASGKTEIANTLVNQYHYIKSITSTTRDKRVYEIDDIHYHFLSKEQFQHKLNQQAFVETNEYQDRMYGLQKDEIGPNKIIILDPNGCNALYRLYPNETCIVYIHSEKEIRQTRMLARGDDPYQISKRILEDDTIFNIKHLDKIHLIIDNHHQTILSIAQDIHAFYQRFTKGENL